MQNSKTIGDGDAEETERKPRIWRLCAFSVLSLPLWLNPVFAAPSQQEVFKSIQDNVGGTTDPKKFFAFMIGAAGLVVLLAVLSNRKKRQITPKVLHHQG